MRSLLITLAISITSGLFAQQGVKIIDAKALETAPDIRKDKAAQAALATAGFSDDETATILHFGDRAQWPEGIRTQEARAENAPYIVNYAAFRLCAFQQDTSMMALLMVPAKSNEHMPEVMRPMADFYLVLPERALQKVEKPKPRPAISSGPQWKRRARVEIIKPDDLYATYDLAADSAGLKALAEAGMSRAEIDAVVFRSIERNWPDGIDNFEHRYPLLPKFNKYRAYLGARWDDKVLLIVPVAKNRRMPVTMRPFVDLYFIYAAPAVEVHGRR